MTADSRITLARDGLAARALEGLVPAASYMETHPMQACLAHASVLDRPDPMAEQQTQILFGEVFDALKDCDDFVLGQARRDGYVGYVARAALTSAGPAPTHWVSVPHTYGFAEPNMKSRATGPFSLNSLISVDRTEGRFRFAEGAGWIAEEHLTPVGVFRTDPVAEALKLLGAGYLWGGRSSAGLDCSGLVQQAFLSCGVALPRDTDQQFATGRAVDFQDLQRSDLVFWRGHMGIMVDGATLLHANAHHMATAMEPLAEAIKRIAAGPTGEPVGYRRL